jgi:glycosyltransferase involved in cell wall biosynthesis
VNILFFSMVNVSSMNERNMYTDLLREFIRLGNRVTMISPVEKRYQNNGAEECISGDGYRIIKPLIGNITNTPLLEKGRSSLSLPRSINICIDKYVSDKIDLFITATPPVTIDGVIKHVKKKYHAKTYLFLKDIWPGNIFKMKLPGGWLSQAMVYSVLRPHETRLYQESDYIGCMSKACMDYIVRENPRLEKSKVHINPNSIEPDPYYSITETEKKELRIRYGIPVDKLCFIYGGTLGVGQGISHVVQCLERCKQLDCHFVIVGRGVNKHLLDEYYESRKAQRGNINLTVLDWVPKPDYKKLLMSCDVGLVFIRKESIVPTFPSRILSYMELGKPIVSCVSKATGVNEVIEEGKFGWGCISDNPDDFYDTILRVIDSDIASYSTQSRYYLENNFTVENSVSIMLKQIL